jgi:uncharacterized protein YndB with AHSA1/START domain
MNIGKFKPATVYTIYIASTPEKVFEALTSPECSRKYFTGLAVHVDPHVGGAFKILLPNGTLHIGGKVLVYDPPHRLSVTWNVTWPGLVEALGETIVTYDIAQLNDAVRLTMTELHEREIPEDILDGGRLGWPAILSSLKTVVETGKPLVVKLEPPVKMLAAMKALGAKVPGA